MTAEYSITDIRLVHEDKMIVWDVNDGCNSRVSAPDRPIAWLKERLVDGVWLLEQSNGIIVVEQNLQEVAGLRDLLPNLVVISDTCVEYRGSDVLTIHGTASSIGLLLDTSDAAL